LDIGRLGEEGVELTLRLVQGALGRMERRVAQRGRAVCTEAEVEVEEA